MIYDNDAVAKLLLYANSPEEIVTFKMDGGRSGQPRNTLSGDRSLHSGRSDGTTRVD